jgi:vancomycin resistance protein VanW
VRGGRRSRGVMERIRALARPVVGPAFRRVVREAQWWSVRSELSTTRSAGALPCVVATHQTPLKRPLLRLDKRLQLNKVVNLRIAAQRLDGLVLEPGQRMSFWRLVGKPTRSRGFLDGLVLNQGRLSAGVGGGLCQMTNLLYWMTLHTPLVVVERWRHSYDVFPDAGRTQPFGSGATCAWPILDIQIVNPTNAVFRLSMEVGETHLHGAWTSSRPSNMRYAVEERAHLVTHDGPGMYLRHNELWRVETDEATGVTSEMLIVANEARLMYEPFLPAAGESSEASGQ